MKEIFWKIIAIGFMGISLYNMQIERIDYSIMNLLWAIIVILIILTNQGEEL